MFMSNHFNVKLQLTNYSNIIHILYAVIFFFENIFIHQYYSMYLCSQWGYQLTQTTQNRGTQPISELLHVENQIACCIETSSICI